jgi:hypothetical protein
LPVNGTASAIGVDDSLWSIGFVRSQTEQKQVFVVPRGGQMSVERGVSQLLASFQSPWVALIPTNRSATPVCRELAARAGSSIIALEDIVGVGENAALTVNAATVAPDPTAAEIAKDNVFRRAQDVWFVRFAGKTVHLRHMVGFEYIAELLRQPGTEIEALILAGRTASDKPAVNSAGLDLADEKALREVRGELERRLAELTKIPAKDWPTKGRLQEEITKLETYLAQAEGRHHQERKVAGSSQRARTAVTNAVTRGIERIGNDHHTLATHLRASLRTGTTLLYLPSEPVDWHF